MRDGKELGMPRMRIYGSDVDPACVELSRANARRAAEDYDFKHLTDKLIAVIESIPEK